MPSRIPNNYVNIGIVTFNRIAFTKKAIESIVRTTNYPYVLSVVDNNSTDGTVEFLKEKKKEGIVKNLKLFKKNIGVARASNIAWGCEPEAAYYMKYDNDIVMQRVGWLKDMIAVIKAIPFIGALGYNVEPVSYPFKRVRGWNIRFKNHNIGGACFLVPRRTERLLGYWCEDFGLYSDEDGDYGERIKLLGLENAYMQDEQAAFHLPAGKAARIDEYIFDARDGEEEKHYFEYRLFKDNHRRLQQSERGLFRDTINAYRSFKKSFYLKSRYTNKRSNSIGITSNDYSKKPLIDIVLRERIRNSYVKKRLKFQHVAKDYVAIGKIYLQKGDVRKAEQWCRRAIKCAQDNEIKSEIYLTIAEIRKTNKKEYYRMMRRAIVYIRRKRNKQAQDYYYIAKMSETIDELLESKKYYLRVVRSKSAPPGYVSAAFFALGDVCERAHDVAWKYYYRRGLSLLIKKSFKTGVELYRIASLYKRLGRVNDAITWFKKINQCAKDCGLRAGSYFHMGEIYLKQSKTKQAQMFFEKCISLNAEHKKAKEYLHQLKQACEVYNDKTN